MPGNRVRFACPFPSSNPNGIPSQSPRVATKALPWVIAHKLINSQRVRLPASINRYHSAAKPDNVYITNHRLVRSSSGATCLKGNHH